MTAATRETIRTIILNTIIDYNEAELDDFAATLRPSNLTSKIDQADLSIVSNNMRLRLYKKLDPELGIARNYDVLFDVPLDDSIAPLSTKHDVNERTALISSGFRFNGESVFLEDDGNGIVRIAKYQANQTIAVQNVGFIDYTKGKIQLINFRIDDYAGDALRLYVYTKNNDDVTSPRNTILTIEPDSITVLPEAVRI